MQPKEIIQNIQSIYDKYFIPLNVQRHMKEVAAVAEMVCDNYKEKVKKDEIIAACLIHDLGNVIKMDFETKESIILLEKKDREKIDFFKKKQKEMREKYGTNAEKADLIIAKELGVNQNIIDLISHKAMHIEGENLQPSTLEEKIAAYADLRCSPQGIVSVEERMKEYYKRYKIGENPEKSQHSKKFTKLIKELEIQLFKKFSIKPKDITNLSTKKYIEKYGVVLK